jgi:hypothetical protein
MKSEMMDPFGSRQMAEGVAAMAYGVMNLNDESVDIMREKLDRITKISTQRGDSDIAVCDRIEFPLD